MGLVDLYACDASNWSDSIRFTGGYSFIGVNSFKSKKGPIQVYPALVGNNYYLVQSTRVVNEYVDVENLRIDVTSKSDSGMDIRVVPLNQVNLN